MTTQLPIAAAEAPEWIAALKPADAKRVNELLSAGMTEEAAAELWLSRVNAVHTAAFGGGSQATNYLASVKAEFRKLVCGDESYEDLRAKAVGLWEHGKTSVISTIAVGIAVKLGIAVAVLTPVVALLLASVCKVGLNAWCNLPA